MSLYGGVGPVDVRKVEVASHRGSSFLYLDERSSMVLQMSSMYCRSLLGGRYIAAIMMYLLFLRCILVAAISRCVGVAICS